MQLNPIAHRMRQQYDHVQKNSAYFSSRFAQSLAYRAESASKALEGNYIGDMR